MKRAALAVLLCLTACGSTHSSSDGGSCIAGIEFAGEFRQSLTIDHPENWPPVERAVQAVNPGCNDSNGPHEEDGQTTLYALRGVAPEVALVTRDRRYVFLSERFFYGARTYPLHDQLYNDVRRRRTCRRVADSVGPVAKVNEGGLWIGSRAWSVDSRTVIRAPLWHGVPQPRVGQQVRVEGSVCDGRGRTAQLIVVTSGEP